MYVLLLLAVIKTYISNVCIWSPKICIKNWSALFRPPRNLLSILRCLLKCFICKLNLLVLFNYVKNILPFWIYCCIQCKIIYLLLLQYLFEKMCSKSLQNVTSSSWVFQIIWIPVHYRLGVKADRPTSHLAGIQN